MLTFTTSLCADRALRGLSTYFTGCLCIDPIQIIFTVKSREKPMMFGYSAFQLLILFAL